MNIDWFPLLLQVVQILMAVAYTGLVAKGVYVLCKYEMQSFKIGMVLFTILNCSAILLLWAERYFDVLVYDQRILAWSFVNFIGGMYYYRVMQILELELIDEKEARIKNVHVTQIKVFRRLRPIEHNPNSPI